MFYIIVAIIEVGIIALITWLQHRFGMHPVADGVIFGLRIIAVLIVYDALEVKSWLRKMKHRSRIEKKYKDEDIEDM